MMFGGPSVAHTFHGRTRDGLEVIAAGLRIEESKFKCWPGHLSFVLCLMVEHLTFAVLLSTQECNWVPASSQGKQPDMLGRNPRLTSISSKESNNTSSPSMLLAGSSS